MATHWYDRLLSRGKDSKLKSFLRFVVTGSFYRISDIRGNTDIATIKTQIDTMRALARDSQISTALDYYATDATTPNTAGDIIWATATEDKYKDVAKIINELFTRWEVNKYVRDHILELATIGNLYIPTTYLYKESSDTFRQKGVVLDNNTIPEPEYDIVPSYKIPPESVVHLWERGEPRGYIMNIDSDTVNETLILPDSAIIHFSLGGLLGDYTIDGSDSEGNIVTYDIQFAQPLMEQAVQPTQTLSLLEDAILLSSLSRTIRFISVEAGTEEEEIRDNLQQVKDTIEQQLSLNTGSGDVQSFVNPQSPNNFIFLPKINGANPIDITDLNMAEASEADSKLLQYYQDKKLSVLGVPKENLNYSSNEGLGGAGAVLSQRSIIYANKLQRLETAYMEGWRKALNYYFEIRNMSGFKDKFQLHMNPVLTVQSSVQFEKRDSAINQATNLVTLLKDMGVTSDKPYHTGLTEILTEVFPQIGADARTWDINVTNSEGGDENAF